MYENALTKAQELVPGCIAAAFVDMRAGMLLGLKTLDSQPREVLGLVAMATGDLFLGKNAQAIEHLFERSRGASEEGAQRLREIMVMSDDTVHLFQRCQFDQDLVLVMVCRSGTNLGMVLTRARGALPIIEAAASRRS